MFKSSSLWLSWLTPLAFFIMSRSAPAWAQSPRYLMGAMGDSITAGFFGDTSLDDFNLELNVDSNPSTNRLMAATPDSGWFENKESYSWASGTDISSHYEKLRNAILKQEPDAQLDVLNFATAGDKAEAIPDQASALADAMTSGDYTSLKYVTLFIGANDACSDETATGTPDSAIVQSLNQAFQTLSQIQQPDPIHILVVGLPQIPNLGTPAIADSSTILGLSCHFFRDDFFQECTSLLNWKSSDEYINKLKVVMHTNAVLRSVAETAGQLFPNISVRYTEKLWSEPIETKDLAIDCFHPGRAGQQLISDELWEEQPWYRS